MKRHILVAAMLVLLPVVILAQETAQNGITGTVKVLVTGLKNNKGEVRISLYNSETTYSNKEAEAFQKLKLPINDKQAEAVFEKLPFGEYAIKLFHDKNGNGELDIFLGIPNEDYAFSNNAAAAFGPAKYEKAKFVLKQAEMTMEIKISAE